MNSYTEYKLIEEAKKRLKEAFRGSVQLRAKKLELEERLNEAKEKLDQDTTVDEVINDPAYNGLAILSDPGFLHDLEREVVAKFGASGKPGKSQKRAAKRSRKRTSVEDKKLFLIDFVERFEGTKIKLSDVATALRKAGTTTQVQAWLKPLNLPEKALKPVSGAKRDGTWFLPENVPWILADGQKK